MPLPKAPTKPASFLTGDTRSNKSDSQLQSASAKQSSREPTPIIKRGNAELRVSSALPALTRAAPPVAKGNLVAASASVPAQKAKQKGQSADRHEPKKLFVLDTNVLMHDPTSLFRFAEHDVYLPMVTLEELDNNKKGMTEVARNARQVSRSLDALAIACKTPIDQGLPLDALGNSDAAGRLFFQTAPISSDISFDLPMGKADNQILAVVMSLQRTHSDKQVVMVSKDINMRVKSSRARTAN